MKLLTIDTATDICGVALTENDKLIADTRLQQRKIHNEKLISSIQKVMQDVDCRNEELDAIALSIGPGSFTGLRIGISVAKGLAFSWNIPIVAVNTLDAFAYGARIWHGSICIAMKVREQELYFATYKSDGGCIERKSEYQIIHLNEIASYLTSDSLLIAYPEKFIQPGVECRLAPFEFCLSNPFHIARLGFEKMQKNETESLNELEPFYLKEFHPKRKKYYAE